MAWSNWKAMATVAMTIGAATTAAQANLVIAPSAGYSITWDGNDGAFHTDSGPAPAPVNLASSVGTQIQSSFFGGAPHNVPGNVNNGTYGNVSSWIANGADGNPWVGVNLGGIYDISSLAWGRDNGMSTANGDSAGGFAGQFTDRSLGVYTVQITTSPVPTTTTNWTTIGTLNYVSSDDTIVGGSFSSFYRHEYAVSATGGPLLASAVRILAPNGNAFDEIELYGTASSLPEPPAQSGLRAWLKGDGDVTLSGPNITQVADHSFNGNHATPGNSPTVGSINGLPAASFNGALQHLNTPVLDEISSSDYEIFVIAKSSSAAIQFMHAGATGGGVANYELHLNSSPGGPGARFIPSSTASASPDTFADLGVHGMFTDGRAHLFNTRVDSGTGYLRIVGMENGDTVANATSAFVDGVLNRLTFGVRGDGSFSYVGEMGEVLIYDRALTAGERRQVERYLAVKWGAPLNVASQTQGGIAFANQDFGGNESGNPAAPHEIEHLNNARYGNGESWLGSNAGGGGGFAGVKFDEAYTISALAFGRDATGVFGDRGAGTYTFQYTLDDFDPTSLASIAAAVWTDFLVVTLPTDGHATLRKYIEFAPIDAAMGVRVLLSSDTLAIDELEVYGMPIPTPSSAAMIGLLGLIGAGRRRRRAA